MALFAGALQVLARQFKAGTLGVVELDVFFEVCGRMAVRTGLIIQHGSELVDVNVLMAIHAELLFNVLELINRLLPASMTVLAGGGLVFSSQGKSGFTVIEL